MCGGRRWIVLGPIGHAEAAAKVDVGDAVPRGAQVGDQAADALERGFERREAGELAADVERDPAHLQSRKPCEPVEDRGRDVDRSEEHTSELQSLMRISYAVFCLKKKNKKYT